jgi:(p)ppGpp synthase/HD superfamily hydrolase
VRLSPRFEAALRYAVDVHRGQLRPGTAIPYIAHPLAVCAIVLEAGGDEDQAIAGLLHDAAEDQGGARRLRDIGERFGERVETIVKGCTDSLEQPRPPWRLRKERYLSHLRQAPADELLVALADKLHNARAVLNDYRALGDRVWERFEGGRDYASWYQAELAAVFRERLPGPLATEMSDLVDRIRSAGSAGQLTLGDDPVERRA